MLMASLLDIFLLWKYSSLAGAVEVEGHAESVSHKAALLAAGRGEGEVNYITYDPAMEHSHGFDNQGTWHEMNC